MSVHSRRCSRAIATSCAALAMLATSATSASATSRVSISYYYPVGVSGPLATIMDNLVASFNKSHPNIHVTPVFSGNYLDTLDKLEAAIAAGNPPAVAVVNHTAEFDLHHLNAVLPLDSVAQTGDYYPTLLQPRIGGHIWGIPFQRSTVVLYYNKTAFAKAGLNPNKPPQTRTQLVADAKALQKAGYTGIEIPTGGTGTNYWQFQPFVVSFGQNLVGTNGTTVYFNSPAAKKALNFWMALSHTYHVEPTGLLPWQDVPGDFESGKVGMIVHSSGSMAAILKDSHFSVGVAFMPKGVGKYRTVLGGGDMYLIKGTSAAQRAAGLTFIRWMTAPAQAVNWSISTGYVPTSPKDLTLPNWKSYVAKTPQASVPVSQLPYAAIEMSTYQLTRVTDLVDSAIDSVVDGSTTVNNALNSAQTQANAILAPYRHS